MSKITNYGLAEYAL